MKTKYENKARAVDSDDSTLLSIPDTLVRASAPDARFDDLVSILANRTRREVLSVLLAADRALSRSELAAAVCERRSDGVHSPERLSVALHHNHLQKLDDVGLVDYDADDRTVAFADGARWPTAGSSASTETATRDRVLPF